MDPWYDKIQTPGDADLYLEGLEAYVTYLRAGAEEGEDMTAGRAVFDWMWSAYVDGRYTEGQKLRAMKLTKEALHYANGELTEFLYDQAEYLSLEEWKEWLDVLKSHKGDLDFIWLALHDYVITDPEKLRAVRDLIGYLLGKPVDMEADINSETLHGLWSFMYRLDMDQLRADRAALDRGEPDPPSDQAMLTRCKEFVETIETQPFPDDPGDESYEGQRAKKQRGQIKWWAASYIQRNAEVKVTQNTP